MDKPAAVGASLESEEAPPSAAWLRAARESLRVYAGASVV